MMSRRLGLIKKMIVLTVGDDLGIFIDRHQLVHLVLQSLNAIVHCSDALQLHRNHQHDDDNDRDDNMNTITHDDDIHHL